MHNGCGPCSELVHVYVSMLPWEPLFEDYRKWVGCEYLKFKLTPVNWNFRYNNTIIMAKQF